MGGLQDCEQGAVLYPSVSVFSFVLQSKSWTQRISFSELSSGLCCVKNFRLAKEAIEWVASKTANKVRPCPGSI